MRRSMMITALTATLSLGAMANGDGVELRSKALASASSGAYASAYVKPEASASTARDPLPALMQYESHQGSIVYSSSCNTSVSTVCYDAADGRIVYRGAREYMPKVDGFSADSVSLRHNAIVFKYTF
jgi:hypothetical protein